VIPINSTITIVLNLDHSFRDNSFNSPTLDSVCTPVKLEEHVFMKIRDWACHIIETILTYRFNKIKIHIILIVFYR